MKPKKLTIYPDDFATKILGSSSTALNFAIEQLAKAIANETDQLSQTWQRGQWNCLADVLNGFAYAIGTVSAGALCLELFDANRFEGIAEKWDISEEDFTNWIAEIDGFSVIRVLAILTAIAFFWEYHETINTQKDEWWTVRFRSAFNETPTD